METSSVLNYCKIVSYIPEHACHSVKKKKKVQIWFAYLFLKGGQQMCFL